MNVGQLCRRRPVTISPDADLVEAAQVMREKHVGNLMVVTTDPRFVLGRIVGVLTDRDIVVSVIAAGADPRELTVRDIMNRPVVTAREEDAIDVCIRTMRAMGVRRLPVVRSDAELMGVVAMDDLLDFLAGEIDGLSGAIRSERIAERLRRP